MKTPREIVGNSATTKDFDVVCSTKEIAHTP
jgi:hypothetical protein